MIVTSSTVSGSRNGTERARTGSLVLAWAGLATYLIACSTSGGVDTPIPDASNSPDAWARSCWYGGELDPPDPTPGVELTMGFGLDTFEPAVEEQTLQLIVGDQGGAHVELNSRMRGLQPGDPDDGLKPAPHTLFTIENDAGERVTALDCTFPLPYRDIGNGEYELTKGRVVLIRQSYLGHLDGERVLVRMEAQDPSGNYGVVQHHMTIADPFVIGPGPDAGVDMRDAGP